MEVEGQTYALEEKCEQMHSGSCKIYAADDGIIMPGTQAIVPVDIAVRRISADTQNERVQMNACELAKKYF
jgi:hypothetical protein